jgi:hypothetical protein
MNIIISIVTFLVVLFIYLHIYYHIKISNYLEVYEIQNLSKDRLEEICNLRQPATFLFDISCFESLKLENVKQDYGSFDIKLRETLETTTLSTMAATMAAKNSELYLPYILNKALLAIHEKRYYSENNEDFLNETSLLKTLQVNDFFLRPPSLMTSNYDYLIGTTLSQTPLRYDVCYRNFFVVLQGDATIKVTPPKNTKYLFANKDYDNFQFSSPINPWNIQTHYQTNFDRIKWLDISLPAGKVIFIPAYWWYSIQFNNAETIVLNFKYKTYMNNLSLMPDYFKCFLQKQNIKHVIMDSISTLSAISVKDINDMNDINDIDVSHLSLNESNINDIINTINTNTSNTNSSITNASNIN